MAKSLGDRVDFRNEEIAKVVKGQNQQHANTTFNYKIIQEEL